MPEYNRPSLAERLTALLVGKKVTAVEIFDTSAKAGEIVIVTDTSRVSFAVDKDGALVVDSTENSPQQHGLENPLG